MDSIGLEVIEGNRSENVSGTNVTEEAENVTMTLSRLFIYSVYAQGTSGIFVWTALLVTCFQVKTKVNSLFGPTFGHDVFPFLKSQIALAFVIVTPKSWPKTFPLRSAKCL